MTKLETSTESHARTGTTEGEDLGRILLDHATEGAWMWEASSPEMLWTDRVYELLALEPGAARPTLELFLEMVYEEDRVELRDEFRRRLESGDHQPLTIRVRRALGPLATLRIRGEIERDESGRPVRARGTVRDVSDEAAGEALRRAQLDVLDRVASGASLESSLEAICRSIEAMVERCACTVMLRDASTGLLSVVSAPSVPREIIALFADIEPGESNGSCAAAVFTGKPVYVRDTRTHESWRGIQPVVDRTGIRACWSHPIFAGGDSPVGSFAICHQEPRTPSRHDLTSLQTAAHLAGIAIRRRDTERDLLREKSVLGAMSDLAPSLIFFCRPDGDPVHLNRRWAEFTGRDQESWRDGGWMEAVHPDDLPRVLGSWRSAVAQRRAFREEYRFVRPSGETVWVLAQADPVFTGAGEHTGFVGIATDITERRKSEERTRLLMAELNHRVKNTLASVLSLCDQTARSSRTPEEFRTRFTGRVLSLARIHEMLSETRWSGVSLDRVIAQIVEPVCDVSRAELNVQGEPVTIPVHAATALCLAIHEMTTNAAKYGSLSGHSGTLSIRWTTEPDGVLEFTWLERGGPPVTSAMVPGMGLSLVRGLVEHELHGSVAIDFPPEGACYRVRAPINAR